MKLSQAISILEDHNHWRRDSSNEPRPFVLGEATSLGIAIDTVLIAAKEHDKIIKLGKPHATNTPLKMKQ